MTTETIFQVEVTRRDIKHSNKEIDPVSIAVARALDVNEEYVQSQRNSILVFTDYDDIESAWDTGDNQELSAFMDAWDLKQMGRDVKLAEINFTITKK